MRYVRPSCVLRVAQVRARLAVVASLVTLMAGAAGRAESQQVVTQAERVITVSKGASALMVNPVPIARFSVGEPDVAEATIVSPTEVIINGKGLGTTTLFVWDNQGQVRVYSVEVTADAPGLERFLRALMPDEEIQVTASRNAVTLSGNVKDPNSVSRAVQMAQTTGATVIDNLVAPPAVQVLLKVRFAEINRTALKDWSARLRVLNPHEISSRRQLVRLHRPRRARARPSGSCSTAGTRRSRPWCKLPSRKATSARWPSRTCSPCRPRRHTSLPAVSFLTPRSRVTGSNSITITFKEFGIRLRFTPNIARNGAIRLKVAPEVCTLDFANGLTISGLRDPVPSNPPGGDRGGAAGGPVHGYCRAAGQREHP